MCRHIGIDSSAAPPEGRILTLRLEVRHRAKVGEQPAAVAGHVHVAAVDGGAPVLPVVPHHALQPGACEVSERPYLFFAATPFGCHASCLLNLCSQDWLLCLQCCAAKSSLKKLVVCAEGWNRNRTETHPGPQPFRRAPAAASLALPAPSSASAPPRRRPAQSSTFRLRVFKTHSVRRPQADLHAAAV